MRGWPPPCAAAATQLVATHCLCMLLAGRHCHRCTWRAANNNQQHDGCIPLVQLHSGSEYAVHRREANLEHGCG